MPVRVVITFKVVDIDHHDCKRLLIAHGTTQFFGNFRIKTTPVCQSGQSVTHRQALQRLIEMLDVCSRGHRIVFRFDPKLDLQNEPVAKKSQRNDQYQQAKAVQNGVGFPTCERFVFRQGRSDEERITAQMTIAVNARNAILCGANARYARRCFRRVVTKNGSVLKTLADGIGTERTPDKDISFV